MLARAHLVVRLSGPITAPTNRPGAPSRAHVVLAPIQEAVEEDEGLNTRDWNEGELEGGDAGGSS